ncbi:hypothetical protein ABID16_002095 [Rhizobium aquaticum]|uniref:Chromosome partitioning protein ParB n=1 Tax=Rhizobium aquaticum TaxID=1549636 RepID=A0ABV2J087_9HYPH
MTKVAAPAKPVTVRERKRRDQQTEIAVELPA